jgi:hypothetical protein
MNLVGFYRGYMQKIALGTVAESRKQYIKGPAQTPNMQLPSLRVSGVPTPPPVAKNKPPIPEPVKPVGPQVPHNRVDPIAKKPQHTMPASSGVAKITKARPSQIARSATPSLARPPPVKRQVPGQTFSATA